MVDRGKIDKAKGKAKEKWGEATDDRSKQGEGKLDQAKGEAKEKFEDVKDKFKDDEDDRG
jgi:uncharacterized protein YjbJ (UPF0337 family)